MGSPTSKPEEGLEPTTLALQSPALPAELLRPAFTGYAVARQDPGSWRKCRAVRIILRCSPRTRRPPSGSSPTGHATSRPGMATPRLVVAHAEGARVTDPDGRTYIDFAGGIGCQNTGHRNAAVVEAIKEQADRYLHQCFMIGVYGRTSRSAAGSPSSPLRRRRATLDPGEHGCRGGGERGEDRPDRDRAGGGRGVRQRLPRTDAARDDDDEQGQAVQGRLRAVRAGGLPRAAP